MKEQFKKAIDMIYEKDVAGGQKLIKEAIKNDARYIAYKKRLQEYGLDYETVTITIDEKVYADIHNILKEFHPEAQKKIIDNVYIDICQKQN